MLKLVRKISSRPRIPCSSFTNDVVNFLYNKLHALGYEVDIDKVTLPLWELTESPTLELISDTTTEKYTINFASYSPATPPDGIIGKVELSDDILMLDSFKWQKMRIYDPKDNRTLGYLLTSRYGCMPQPLPQNSAKFPTAIIPSKLYNKILLNSKKASFVVKLTILAENYGSCEARSVIAYYPNKKKLPLVCAHIDSMYNSPGAHDNASGVAVALELAKFCSYEQVPCNFAFFNGEESNKAGSYKFVSTFAELELQSMISYVIEIDSVGIGDQITLLCSKKLNKKLKKIDWYRHDLKASIFINPQTKIRFSDVWPFMEKKIPVIRMLTKDNLQGLDQKIMHMPNDTIDYINEQVLIESLLIAKEVLLNIGSSTI